jgi:hypothetical protein
LPDVSFLPRTQEAVKKSRSNRLVRLEDASNAGTSLDLARCPWYSYFMIQSVRIANRKHVTRFGWAVKGVVR